MPGRLRMRDIEDCGLSRTEELGRAIEQKLPDIYLQVDFAVTLGEVE